MRSASSDFSGGSTLAGRVLRLVAGLTFACLLAACGGGGGGGSPTDAPGNAGTPPPQSVGNGVTLDRSSVLLVTGTNNASDVPSQVVRATFTGAGLAVGTLPGTTLPAWLSVTAPSTATTTTTVAVTVAALPQGLAPGDYTTTLRFATANADKSDLSFRDIVVTLAVVPTTAPAQMSVTGLSGGAALQGAVAIGTTASWTARTSAAWITIDRSSGTGNANIVVATNPAGLAPGDYSGTVTIEDVVNHAAQVVSVNLGVDAKRLLVRRPGVALSLVGSQARLTGTILVTDNGNAGVKWSAVSSQPWLQLGQSEGTADSGLGVTANATGLPDGMNYATVTISPRNEPSVANTVSVRVGLYVDRAATFVPNVSATARVSSSGGLAFGFVADPIRPYFYHSQGDGQIDIYNSYTAARAGSIVIAGAGLGAMAVSPDGTRLYVADQARGRIYPVMLDSLSVGPPFSGARLPQVNFDMAYTEVSGMQLLVTSEFQVIDAILGTVSLVDGKDPKAADALSVRVAAQRDGKAVFFQGRTLANHSLARFAIGFRGALSFRRTHLQNETGDGNGLALDAGDTRLYTAATGGRVDNAVTSGFAYSASDLSAVAHFPAGSSDASGVATSPNGRVFVSRWLDHKVDTFDASLSRLDSYSFGDHIDTLCLSGDGRRLGLYVQSGGTRVLRFTDVP